MDGVRAGIEFESTASQRMALGGVHACYIS